MLIGHWRFVVKHHATTKAIHNTHAALSEPPLETDPALRARQHIYAKGLYYMEPAAFHSNKRNLTWGSRWVELMQSRCVVMSS